MPHFHDDIIALRIVQLFIDEYGCDGSLTFANEAFTWNISVNYKLAGKLSCIGIILHRKKLTLCFHLKWSRKCNDFTRLEFTIGIIEALHALATNGCVVSVLLKLPICPA